MIFNDRKKRTMALLLVLVLAMVAFAGCGDDDDSGKSDATKQAEEEVIGEIKVKLSIDFPDAEDQKDVEDKIIGLPAESSALDLLFAYANENNLAVETEGDDDPYVVSIGGVSQGDTTGWVFTINDESIMESSGKAMLKDGDEVEWEFTNWDDLNDD